MTFEVVFFFAGEVFFFGGEVFFFGGEVFFFGGEGFFFGGEGFFFVGEAFFVAADAVLLTFGLTVFAFTDFVVVFVVVVFFVDFATPLVFVVFAAGLEAVFFTTVVFALTTLLAVFATFSLLAVLFFTGLTTFFAGMLSPVGDRFAGFESPCVVDFVTDVFLPFRTASTWGLFTRKRPLSDIPAIEQCVLLTISDHFTVVPC